MKIHSTVGACIALAALILSVTPVHAARDISAKMLKSIVDDRKEFIRTSLSDPESARFTNLMLVTSEDKKQVLCGQINAKNKMGGYVGAASFWSTIGSSGIVDGRNDEKTEEFKELCLKSSRAQLVPKNMWN